MKPRLFQAVGLTGSVIIAVIFVQKPSWPTPDKLVIFMTFVFMIFSQARAMLVRLAPFIGLLLVYESLRGLAPHLNSNVNYTFMPYFDKFVFGDLPTQSLQQLLWNGSVMLFRRRRCAENLKSARADIGKIMRRTGFCRRQ